jgi:hypothetical protein
MFSFCILAMRVTLLFGSKYINQTPETEQFNFLSYEYSHNGEGVALGVFTNDGLLDVFFSGNLVKCIPLQPNFMFSSCR